MKKYISKYWENNYQLPITSHKSIRGEKQSKNI